MAVKIRIRRKRWRGMLVIVCDRWQPFRRRPTGSSNKWHRTLISKPRVKYSGVSLTSLLPRFHISPHSCITYWQPLSLDADLKTWCSWTAWLSSLVVPDEPLAKVKPIVWISDALELYAFHLPCASCWLPRSIPFMPSGAFEQVDNAKKDGKK